MNKIGLTEAILPSRLIDGFMLRPKRALQEHFPGSAYCRHPVTPKKGATGAIFPAQPIASIL